jgi:hypothetical protein
MSDFMTGIYPDMSSEEYHKGIGLSFTGLKILSQKSPAHYRAHVESPKEPTPAMLLGQAVHCAVLEPVLFAATYAVAPKVDKRTKLGKETFAVFESENRGKIILDAEDAEQVKAIQEAVRSHPQASQILKGGVAENSAFWTDPTTGALCKVRPDYLRVNDGLIVDLKTTEDASPRGFERSIMQYMYHVQTAFYCEGLTQVTGKPFTEFVHIVVEKQAPYAVALYVLDDASIEKAREQMQDGLRKYAECLKTNQWPGYDSEIQPMSLPSWAW